MATKTATTHLAEDAHGLLSTRAKERGMSVSQYLERLVLDDLSNARRGGESAENGGVAGIVSLRTLLRRNQEESLQLIEKLGSLVFETRAAFVNFVLVYAQVASGSIDPKRFDWRKWAEDNIVAKGGEHRDANLASTDTP